VIIIWWCHKKFIRQQFPIKMIGGLRAQREKKVNLFIQSIFKRCLICVSFLLPIFIFIRLVATLATTIMYETCMMEFMYSLRIHWLMLCTFFFCKIALKTFHFKDFKMIFHQIKICSNWSLKDVFELHFRIQNLFYRNRWLKYT